MVVAAWFAALVVVSVAHRWIPQSGWLLVHLLGIGAASNAILIWSGHFTDALLRRSATGARRPDTARLIAFNTGAVVLVAGMVGGWWPVVLVGGCVVAGVAGWHGITLLRRLRAALPSRFGHTVRYYIAAATMLPVGAGFGIAMANSGLPGELHERLVLGHAAVNVLGWVGLTVLGTLVTLWPTMLRTRMAQRVETAARRGLPALILALAVGVAGALAGIPLVTAAGTLGYLAAALYVLEPHLDEIRRKHPADFATLSVLAGIVWLLGSLIYLTVALATASTPLEAAAAAGSVTAALLAGFLVQVLLGALTYLIPVVIGGRAAVQGAMTELERGASWRLSVANAGLLVCVLPIPSLVRVLCSVLVLVAFASFLPLAVRAVLVARRMRGTASKPGRPEPVPARKRIRSAAAGLGIVVLGAAAGIAADPAAAGLSTVDASNVRASGYTTEVEVQIEGMRFVPDVLEVPVGDRLVVTLVNTGTDRHDLVLANGTRTARIGPGETATLDAGLVGGQMDGWCSVAGHRQMGMTLTVEPTGVVDDLEHTDHGSGAEAGSLTSSDVSRSLGADPAAGFVAHDPVAPAPTADHRITLAATDEQREVAPGITQRLWTFGGTAPGPVLRGRVGDVFEITLVNDGSIGHSIDFHAGSLSPDEPMRTIEPGESLVYRFTATRSGIWLYHCSTMPMSLHIANGMFGAVIIDPPDLVPVAREYVLVQSELYLGAEGGEADSDKITAEDPDLVVFNGYANQYDHRPLQARVGERVRIWVLAAGPNRGTSFHVVGGQFDTVFSEGDYRLRPDTGGSQALGLFPAQGGFVELEFPEPGRYPFVSHSMVDAERGAHGIVEVRE
ncbi:multicopper oxidase domain-containing protein [Rhodococcus sp. HNM0563]|uniref:multicopper oxidase domain-containing protein n=1 Tax=Rhodococcus sp. HNM0563 TaxID=2716339 RepID=UPI00146EB81F|nr:multicopper oxidase domain-containing protein [Rhodococcus sp. HNM0563]NLU62742.1 multicopper oxidase domain-containing protein [Rhodococcus sp. HNM0563]